MRFIQIQNKVNVTRNLRKKIYTLSYIFLMKNFCPETQKETNGNAAFGKA